MSIYFVQALETNAVKIGYTSGDAIRRVRQLQTSCPDTLKILHVVLGEGRSHEKELHRLFASSHIRREWFHLYPHVSDYLGVSPLFTDEIQRPDRTSEILCLEDEVEIARLRSCRVTYYEKTLSTLEYNLFNARMKLALRDGPEELCLVLAAYRSIFRLHEPPDEFEREVLRKKRVIRTRAMGGSYACN